MSQDHFVYQPTKLGLFCWDEWDDSLDALIITEDVYMEKVIYLYVSTLYEKEDIVFPSL